MMQQYDVVVIGAGFYGCMIAIDYAKQSKKVLLLEKTTDIMLRASSNNQARIHNGYHYPRSQYTAASSHRNYARFIKDFKECVVDDNTMVYAIAKNSKTNVAQFKEFCKKHELPLAPAPVRIKKLFNTDLIDDVFLVEEAVYDGKKLATLMKRRLADAGVELRLNARVTKLGAYQVNIGKEEIFCAKTINCTYANINTLLKASNMPELGFKEEVAHMPVVKVPPELKNVGVTIMDGDFFSLIPYPPKKLHTVHHVKYTPDLSVGYPLIFTDIMRYMPILEQVEYKSAIYELKVIASEDEYTDARPIVCIKDWAFRGLHIVLGAKIDNVYDVLDRLRNSDKKELNVVSKV